MVLEEFNFKNSFFINPAVKPRRLGRGYKAVTR